MIILELTIKENEKGEMCFAQKCTANDNPTGNEKHVANQLSSVIEQIVPQIAQDMGAEKVVSVRKDMPPP